METFDFFPFITPTNAGIVVFPDFDTVVKTAASAPAAGSIEELNESLGNMKITDTQVQVDIEKIKRSGKKAGSKTKDVYNLLELKDIAKSLGISFKSNIAKKTLIDLILKENKIF